jgi:hypothetical protein
VVTSYAARARFARAETATVPRTRLLRGLVATATHVAELPCGAGYFLTDFGDSGLVVTLADANAAMLAQARDHARDAGLRPDRTHTIHPYLQGLVLPEPVDLVVASAALNRRGAGLAAGQRASRCRGAGVGGLHPSRRRSGHGRVLRPGPPAREWFADRWFDPAQAGGAVLLRRRQIRDGDRLRIDFDYRGPADARLHATTVELTLFSADVLATAFTAGDSWPANTGGATTPSSFASAWAPRTSSPP